MGIGGELMRMIFTRAGLILECVECGQRFAADSPELEAGHDCEVAE